MLEQISKKAGDRIKNTVYRIQGRTRRTLHRSMIRFLTQETVTSHRKKYPIDVVYTWVNGHDTIRQQAVQYHLTHDKQAQPRNQDATTANRYTDREELKYSIRSLARFAPWIRKIYIITGLNQRPEWLREHPDVVIVPDSSIFPDKKHLPTFNSQAIECHLDRIENLSEYFIYMNDDMFLGNEISPLDLVWTDGVILGGLAPPSRVSPRGIPEESELGFLSAWKNNNMLLDSVFGEKQRVFPNHQLTMLSKNIFGDTRRMFPSAFERTSVCRFRSVNNINPVGVAFYVGLYTGRIKITNHLINHYIPFKDDNKKNSNMFKRLMNRRPHLFCINDVTTEKGATPEIDSALKQLLETYFPVKSPYEV
jgi:hypothetical protein